MNSYVRAITVAAFCALAATASAKETVYSCEATHKSRWGYVAPEVIFFLDDEAGTVRVLDGIIQNMEGGPIKATYSKRSDAVRTLVWRLDNMQTQSGTVDATYRANLNLSRQTYTVKVTLSGTGSDPRGQGRCKILK